MTPMLILEPELRPARDVFGVRVGAVAEVGGAAEVEVVAEIRLELSIAPAVTGIPGLIKAIMELVEGSGLSYKGVFAFRVFEISSWDWSELTLLEGR
jgi:hypothetical protein